MNEALLQMPEVQPSVRVEPPRRSAAFMLLKRCVQALFTVAVLPRLASYHLGRSILGARAFGAASESIARIPGLRGIYFRQAFYRQTLTRCGQDVSFGWQSVFSMTEAEVGDRVYIGRFCSIGYAAIEDEVMLADGVQVLSGGHEHRSESSGKSMQQHGQQYTRVTIGRGAWIGAGAVIMKNVGAGAIVGAGAVVTKPVPAGGLVYGVPAAARKSSESAS
jgi:acetyltransferase-like isoleucine patch superfamily enzyme